MWSASAMTRQLRERSRAIVAKTFRTDVIRLRTNESAIPKLLEAVRGPAGDASDGESRREELRWQAQTVQQERGVELDVGVEPSIGLALTKQSKRSGFDTPRQLVQRSIAVVRIEPLGGVRQHVGARVAHAVDTMAESHQALAAIELRADDGLGVFGRADFQHHVERRTGRAAVKRTLERAEGACDRRAHVGTGCDERAAR